MIFRILILVFAFSTQTLFAHEFWLSPLEYQLEKGKTAKADFRVGEGFEGTRHPFLEMRTAQNFVILGNGTRMNISARSGNRPAFQANNLPEGLSILVHQTTPSDIVYQEWQKFADFTVHKGFAQMRSLHKLRGLPAEGFRESFDRYAKALIAVGKGHGQDRAVGLDIELIALKNPYTDDLSEGLPVLAQLDGIPRKGTQIEVFERKGDTVTITPYRTNAKGIAVITVRAGAEYMLDNVALFPLDQNGNENAPVWHSKWANLTFMVPR